METKRLQRSSTERMVLGVCGGLAEYFDIDATLVRLIFVLATFANGAGILAYIILAIVMPRPGAVGQQPREVVRENMENLGRTARDVGEHIRGGFGGGAYEEPTVVEGEVVNPPAPARDRRATAGVVLIVIGLLFLLSNLGFFWWLSWRQFWPLVLIVIGLAILWQRGRR